MRNHCWGFVVVAFRDPNRNGEKKGVNWLCDALSSFIKTGAIKYFTTSPSFDMLPRLMFTYFFFGGERATRQSKFYDRLRGNNHQSRRVQSVVRSRKVCLRLYQYAALIPRKCRGRKSENVSIIMCLSIYLHKLFIHLTAAFKQVES